jgi:hypothetical protein
MNCSSRLALVPRCSVSQATTIAGDQRGRGRTAVIPGLVAEAGHGAESK